MSIPDWRISTPHLIPLNSVFSLRFSFSSSIFSTLLSFPQSSLSLPQSFPRYSISSSIFSFCSSIFSSFSFIFLFLPSIFFNGFLDVFHMRNQMAFVQKLEVVVCDSSHPSFFFLFILTFLILIKFLHLGFHMVLKEHALRFVDCGDVGSTVSSGEFLNYFFEFLCFLCNFWRTWRLVELL